MKGKTTKTAYFLGIGGIGMSAIARYLHAEGYVVSGYDKTSTVLTRKLEAEGIRVYYEEDISHIPEDPDLLIYTPAIPDTHKELRWLRAHDFDLKKRAEVLGIISREKKCLAVAGTHGKTTTTSLLTHILKVGGIDCTAFLGGIAENYKSNFVSGKSNYVVVEADEYDRSFLHLSPEMAAVTSTDADHLDIYGDAESMLESGFGAFVKKVNPDGFVFLNNKAEVETAHRNAFRYGIDKGDYRAENIRVEEGWFVFDFCSAIENIGGIKTALPGRHNIENAVAAIALAQHLQVKGEAIKEALSTFKGIKRRFEFLHRREEVVYIDDYAHHPSELNAAIGAAKELFPGKKITGIFQPHLYSRTNDFQEGFAEELSQLDEVILLDIYPARELPMPGVTSKIVFDKISNPNKLLLRKEDLMNELQNRKFEVLMTLGAGDIDVFREPIRELVSG